MAEKAYRSEDEAGLKLDRCVADTMLKVAGGLAIGVVVTAAFFKVNILFIRLHVYVIIFRVEQLRFG